MYKFDWLASRERITDKSDRNMRVMERRIGEKVESEQWVAVDGRSVEIPDPQGRTVHIQFSRWAGCPICNTHLANFRKRAAELEANSIIEVAVFHSPADDIVDLRGDLPFALIADPDKKRYRSFGVRESPLFWFHPRAFWRLISEAAMGRTAERVHGGVFCLPADFIIDGVGTLRAAHYGRHADDAMSVDEVLTFRPQGGVMQAKNIEASPIADSRGDNYRKQWAQAPAHASAELTPTQIVKLLGVGFFYAVLVWVFIRFQGPAGAFRGVNQVINYISIIPITFGTIALARWIGGSLAKRHTLTVLAIGAIAGPIPEGIALGWFPSLYGNDPVVLVRGLAWLLWAIGVGFVIGLQMTRADKARAS